MTQAIESTGGYHPGMPLTAKEAETQADTILSQYAGWATALMRVVEAKELFALIAGKKYLEFEAWQLIGTFDRAFVDTDNVTPVERDGELIGYICHAKIIRDGIHAGGATQFCGLDAFPCRGKEGSAKDNAAISAAQTWAGSKALKMRYSAVAVLGGYGGATAEEMRRAQEEAPDTSQHYCETHKTNWFKRGRMKNYAHPIGDTDQWCNEPTVASAPPEATRPSVQSCPIHNVRLGRDSQKRWCHKLLDGSFCFGVVEPVPPEAGKEPTPSDIPDIPNVPTFDDTPLGQLQREVFEWALALAQMQGRKLPYDHAEMEWDHFKGDVLKMPWEEWVRLGGTIDSARKRWLDHVPDAAYQQAEKEG